MEHAESWAVCPLMCLKDNSSYTHVSLTMSSAKWRSSCLGLSVSKGQLPDNKIADSKKSFWSPQTGK